MEEQIDKLKSLIESSQKVLITSHIGPDGDSVSSSLLLYQILRLNFPNKAITLSMEEAPFGLNFLEGYEQIQFQPLPAALKQASPELLFVLDANAWHRVTRSVEDTRQTISELHPKIVVIDHHEGDDIEGSSLYINDKSPAATLDIYSIFIEKMALAKPEGYAQTALTGIYTDSGGFVHQNFSIQRVFEVVPKLIAEGADLEIIVSNLNKISEKGLEILKQLYANTKLEDGYTYSFISDSLTTPDNHEAVVQATEAFRVQLLRNVEDRPWGFIVYRDVMAPESTYSVSFRALSGKKDVSLLARALGGGGHKPAAGAKFAAQSVEQALDMVKKAIEDTPTS